MPSDTIETTQRSSSLLLFSRQPLVYTGKIDCKHTRSKHENGRDLFWVPAIFKMAPMLLHLWRRGWRPGLLLGAIRGRSLTLTGSWRWRVLRRFSDSCG